MFHYTHLCIFSDGHQTKFACIIGTVSASRIKLKHQDKGHIFGFLSSDTVGKLIGQVEKTTGSRCIISDMGLYIHHRHLLIIAAMFVIIVK